MTKFEKKVAAFRQENIGAACFDDNGKVRCINNFTESMAIAFAKEHGIKFLDLHPGQSCKQVNC